MYRSTKTWGHECGFSAAFRQWRADSHCNLLHGYALAITIVFESEVLDIRNWVMDFGGMKAFKFELAKMFDHKTLMAKDDPESYLFQELADKNVIELVEVDAVGCEAFAKMVYDMAVKWKGIDGAMEHIRIVSVEVREHGANSALYLASPMTEPVFGGKKE